MKTWLTAKDIAGQCMVSKTTVRRWIKTGRLAAIQLPSRHFRIRPEDYRDFLDRYHMEIEEGPFEPKS
jgi:excisionase family DNA binding protein